VAGQKPRQKYPKTVLIKRPLIKTNRKITKKLPVRVKNKRLLPRHKRILLHPLSIMILMCVGIFLVCWTRDVVATDVQITAVIEAQPINQGAIISSPVDGSILTNIPITVTGSCPASQSYVKLYDNNIFSGVAWCSETGTFNIQTDLFSGSNNLVAQDYNTTDLQGPLSPIIVVNYNPPIVTSSPAPSSSSKQASTQIVENTTPSTTPLKLPLLIISDFHYQAFTVGTSFTWKLKISGGVPPYSVYIDWGDGKTTKQIYTSDPTFNISHIYSKPGYYSIIARSVDASGDTRILQLAAFIAQSGSGSIRTITTGITSTGNTLQGKIDSAFKNTKGWLWIAWPSFILVILMIFSFWLGEQEVYLKRFNKKRQLSYQSSRH